MTAGRVIWGLIVLVLGVLLLAANFGWIDWGFVLSLWQLWPLILVLIGIGLLFRGRNQTLGAVVMIVVVLLGIGLAWTSYQGVGWNKYTTTEISSPPVQGQTSAQARINIGASQFSIVGGGTGHFVTGASTSRATPSVTYSTSGNVFLFEINQKWQNVVGLNFGNKKESLDLTLVQGIPWSIDIKSGATTMSVDLTDVLLADFTVATGASSLKLTVGPSVEPNSTVKINGGAASYDLSLPRSLNIVLRISTGLTSQNIDPNFQKAGDTWIWNGGGNSLSVEIKSGVSSIRVRLY